MMQLLSQSARSLIRRPGFSLFAILTLALCTSGSVAIFSAAKAILFQELPCKDIERLVMVHSFYLPNSTETDLSWTEARDWGKRSQLLEKVAPFLSFQNRLLIQQDSVERIEVNYVTPEFFEHIGVQPQLGRTFNAQENGAPGSAASVILSHDLWERTFAKDPGILGRLIRLNSRAYTVVGVMPRQFANLLEWRFPNHHDAWLPAIMAGETFASGVPLFESRDQRAWFAMARLKPGVTLEQARKEADAIGVQLQKEFPESNKDYVARIVPLREYMFGDLFAGMKILLAGALLVLLIGCANVANLFLVRQAERSRELSLHLSLGASRWRLVQQVFAESAILSVLGGLLGAVLAVWGVKLMKALLELPPFARIEIDGVVLAIVLVVILSAGLLFALLPAIGVARMEEKGVLQQMRSGGRTHSAQGRTGLLVFQVAVVVVLLVVAGLLLRSFLQLKGADLGIKTDHLLTCRLSLGTERYEDRSKIAQALEELQRRLAVVPGVDGMAFWMSSTPGLSTQFSDFRADDASDHDQSLRADLHRISPGAVKLIGVPLLRGREFNPEDTSDKPRVGIVSQALADRLWPGKDPIGQRFYRPGRENEARTTVVGIIPETRFEGRFADGNPDVLIPISQSPTYAPPLLLVRTKVSEASLIPALRKAIKEVDPQIPVYDIAPMEHLLRDEEREFRLNATVVGLYAALALTLALLGLYSLLSYSVIQRTREIGVRMALGADRHSTLRLVMARGLLLALSGLLLGLLSALVLTRFLASVLFGVKVSDPLTFSVVVVVFGLMAVAATYLPARRTLRVDPTTALRSE